MENKAKSKPCLNIENFHKNQINFKNVFSNHNYYSPSSKEKIELDLIAGELDGDIKSLGTFLKGRGETAHILSDINENSEDKQEKWNDD